MGLMDKILPPELWPAVLSASQLLHSFSWASHVIQGYFKVLLLALSAAVLKDGVPVRKDCCQRG
jgi:hypothetical protein